MVLPPPGTQFRIALTFVLLIGLFNGLYQVEKRYSGRFLDQPYTSLTASIATRVGSWILPFPVNQRNDLILGTEGAAVVVCAGCNGLETLFLMLAGLLAYPAPWRRRLRALLLYLPLVFALNLLRIVMLLFVMAAYPAHIEPFHAQIGQGIMVVFVLAFLMHYIRRTTS